MKRRVRRPAILLVVLLTVVVLLDWLAARTACPRGCTEPPPGCEIKGNISTKKSREKIYHVPGQRFYEVTVIDPQKGERWFCTEEEAQDNGWRRAKV